MGKNRKLKQQRRLERQTMPETAPPISGPVRVGVSPEAMKQRQEWERRYNEGQLEAEEETVGIEQLEMRTANDTGVSDEMVAKMQQFARNYIRDWQKRWVEKYRRNNNGDNPDPRKIPAPDANIVLQATLKKFHVRLTKK